jgi:hypothetical protein
MNFMPLLLSVGYNSCPNRMKAVQTNFLKYDDSKDYDINFRQGE